MHICYRAAWYAKGSGSDLGCDFGIVNLPDVRAEVVTMGNRLCVAIMMLS